MTPLKSVSYEEFNRMRKDKGFSMTEVHSWQFKDKEGFILDNLRALFLIKPKEPNPC